MNARSRSACGDSATLSGILQVTHITWRSIVGSEVRGVAARGARPRAATRRSARPQQRRAATRRAAPARRRRRAHELSRERDRAVEEGLVDLAAGDRDDPALAVDDEALGELVGAVGVGEVAGRCRAGWGR